MCHYHSSHTLVVKLSEYLHHLYGSLAVESACRLIGEYYGRIGDKGACYRHTLLLSTRQLAGKMVGPLPKSHAVELLESHGITLTSRHTLIEQRQRYILHRILIADQIERLEHESDKMVTQVGSRILSEITYEASVEYVFTGIIVVKNTENI